MQLDSAGSESATQIQLISHRTSILQNCLCSTV